MRISDWSSDVCSSDLSHAGEPGRQVLGLLEKVSVVFFGLVGMLMKFAPIGAFGAMAFTIGRYGVESLANLGLLIATFYLPSLFFVIVILGAVARLCGLDRKSTRLNSSH